MCITITTGVAFFVARSLYKWECPFPVKKNKEIKQSEEENNQEHTEEHVEIYYEANDIKSEDTKSEESEESEDGPPENYPLPPVPQFSIKPQLSVPTSIYFEFGNINQTNQ